MTQLELSQLVGHEKAARWIDPLNDTFERYGINSTLQRAHFLAQILHETGGLKWLRELWGPTEAQERYEGREDLGNTQPGDGFRYRGRGAIQLTGRYNYTLYTRATGIDFLANPDLLEQPPHALLVAGWYWHTHNLNREANQDDVKAVTRRINGGLNGLTDRVSWLNQAKRALKLDS